MTREVTAEFTPDGMDGEPQWSPTQLSPQNSSVEPHCKGPRQKVCIQALSLGETYKSELATADIQRTLLVIGSGVWTAFSNCIAVTGASVAAEVATCSQNKLFV